jgi:hypothetical protein
VFVIYASFIFHIWQFGRVLSYMATAMEDPIDENELVRQATLRICGSLDIEKGLQ